MKHIKNGLLSCMLTAGFALSGFAATGVERDHHFWSVKNLVDREIMLVAEPELEAFKAASYPDGSKYSEILRLLYCRTFQLYDPKLGDEVPALEKSVSKTGNKDIDALISDEVSAAWVLKFVNPLLRDLLPDSPAKPLGEDKKARVEKRVKLLCEKASFALTELKKQIASNAAQEEKNDLGELDEKTGIEVTRKGVELRLNYANAFYFTYLALREVLYRGDEFEMDKSAAEEFMKNLVGSNEQIEELGTWDWNFADYQIFLRHRINVMLSDTVRVGHKYGDYGQITAGFSDVIDVPLDSYPGSIRPLIMDLKLTALADLLYWHVVLQKERENLVKIDAQRASASNRRSRGRKKERPNYAEEGIKIWERYYEEFDLSDELRKNKKLTNKVAQVYFVAGQLYRLAGKAPKAIGLVKEILDIKPNHYYYGNARRWKTYILKPLEGGAEVSFQSPVAVVNPEQVLNSISDIFAEARGTEDKKQRKKMYLNAAVSLRDALYSLQDPQYRKMWFKHGPTVYYQYAYALYKLEMYEHAALTSLEGALAYKDYFARKTKNPFHNKSGKFDEAKIDGLKKLVGNLSPYVSQLRRVDKGDATKKLYGKTLKTLEVYEQIVKGPNPKSLIVTLISEKKYDEALGRIDELAQKPDLNASDKIWVSRMVAYTHYLVWDKEYKEGGKNGAENAAATKAKLEAAIKTCNETVEKLKNEKDVGEEVEKSKTLIVSIEVGVASRLGDHLKVLLTLDDKYWENPPEEGTVLQRVAGQMCGASYRYHIKLMKAKDPQKTIEMWPHIRRTSMALTMAREKTGAALTNSSKALAETYKNIGKLADWFIAVKGKDKSVPDFNFADMNKIVQQAPFEYGNLMMPVASADGADLKLVRFVGRTLHRGGDNARAAELYEKYLKETSENAELMAFKNEPKDVVDSLGDVLIGAPLSSLRKKWPVVRDLLVDKPGFIDEYKKHGGTTKKLSEEKIDYYQAMKEIDVMLKDAKARKPALGGDYEKVVEVLNKLRGISDELFSYLQVMDYTVQAYLSENRMEKALPYVRTLIAFDPIHPRYRALNVEIVLRGVKGDNPPTEQEIKDARGITADLIAQYKNKPDKAPQYWLAYCQAYELTAVLREADKINKSLKRHHAADITPILFDLAVDNGDGTYTAKNPEAAALITRYLALYDIKGITFPKPYEAKEEDEQLHIKMVKE